MLQNFSLTSEIKLIIT